MGKKYYIIGIVTLIIIAGAIYLTNPKSDEISKTQAPTQSEVEKDNNKVQDSIYSIEFNLENNKKLLIKKDANAFAINTAFSTPDSVTIQLADKEIIEGNNTISYLEVIPTEQANKRADNVTSTVGYKSLLDEYMATISSTQCAILKPTDFNTKKIGNYDVSYAEREDYCTFNLDTPETQAMHMYGFETEGYTVILSTNGNVDNLPNNPNKLMEKIIELFEIK